MALSSQITRRLKAPFAVILTAALVGMGGGVAFADDTVPAPPTSSASASTEAGTSQSDAKAKPNTSSPKPKNTKVFVCKYVGKPGVNERLQTGNNPISVSVNAIKGYSGVGSYFNDAQGRSYVLAVDHGQPEPDVSQCPAPDSPPVVLKDAVAAVTPVAPTCSANGSAVLGTVTNATLVGTLDTSVGAHEATFNATSGHAFADGSTTHKVSYTVAPKLTGKQCAPFTVLEPKVYCAAKTITFHVDVPAGTTDEVGLDFMIYQNGVQVFGGFWGSDKSGDMVINLADLSTSTDGTYTYTVLNDATGAEVKTGSFTLSCSVPVAKKVTAVNGVFADTCGLDFNLTFTPAVTEGVKYVQTRTGNTVKVTAEALKGYELTNPEWSQTATDQLVACPVVPKKVTAVNGVFTDVCGPDFNLSFTPAVTEGVKYVQTRTGNTVKVTAEALKGYELTNPEWSQTATDALKACQPDEVAWPQGSVKLTCSGGSVVLNNSKSNVEVGYSIVVVYKDGSTEFYNFVLKAGEVRSLPLPALPGGTKVLVQGLDTDLDSATAPSDCVKKPAVTNQCSNGTNPGDVNQDGKKDAKDCVKKPVVKADKPIVNAGVDTVASPVHGGSGFNGTAAGIAAAAVLLAALVVEVLRRRRTAPVNNR